jgi:aerobic carbon-monoxide dehydrogenase medium subunit
LQPDEIIIEIHFPPWPHGRCWAFHEFARRKGDFAIAGVAVFFDLDDASHIVDAHVGVIGAADTPIRLGAVEKLLNGRRLDDELIGSAACLASGEVDPGSDIHAATDYRKALVGTLTARALRDASLRDGEIK